MMTTTRSEIPPYDLEVERALLGAILVQPRDLSRASEIVKPSDFFKKGHGTIFAAMLRVLQRGEPLDGLTLTAELRQRGDLDAVGGQAALAQILEEGALAVNWLAYAGLVKDFAVKREILALGDRLVNGAQNGRSTTELLDVVSSALGTLRSPASASTVVLTPRAAPMSRHLVERLLLDGETTVLFGDGGSGKSLFALAVAVALSTGLPLPGGFRPTRSVPTLLLDWESCREEHEDRLARLCAGLGVSLGAPILYRPMTRALADETPKLLGEIRQADVGFVIVDSLAPACGAEPETADAAIRAMNALRTFAPATRLVVAHVSKMAADQRTGAARPFGSVFVQNIARSVWEVKKADDQDGDLVLGLYHRKVDTGRLVPPLGVRLEFEEQAIRAWPQDLADRTELLAKMSIPWRILKALAHGAVTLEELAETIQAGKNSTDRTLRRLRVQGKITRLPDGRWGLGAR